MAFLSNAFGMRQPFLVSLWSFIQKPRWNDADKHISWTHFVQALAWGIVGAFSTGIIIQIVVFFLDIELSNSVVTLVEEAAWYEMLYFAAIVAPIMEEFIFRLPLSSVRWVWQVWLIGLVAWLVYFFGMSGTPLIITALVAGALVGVIGFIRSSHWAQVTNQIQGVLIGSSVLIFGVIHLLNYESLPLLYGGILVFVLPQIWGGILMAYLRVKQSFRMAVLYHCVYNFFLAAPVVLVFPIIDQPDLESLSSSDELVVGLVGVAMSIGSALLVGIVVWSIYQVTLWKKSNQTPA